MPGSRSPKRKPGQRRKAQLQAGREAAQSFWSAVPRRRVRDRGCPQSGTGKPTRLWSGSPSRLWSRPRPWIGMPPRFWIGTGIWSEVYGRLRKRRHRKRKERNRKQKRRPSETEGTPPGAKERSSDTGGVPPGGGTAAASGRGPDTETPAEEYSAEVGTVCAAIRIN